MPAGLSAHETQLHEEWQPGTRELEEALAHILASVPFRTSRQCQDLLRYIVERSARGEEASLRERVIGMEVFGRKATYDTSEDPVVRVRAADVRKRLAQYYQSRDASHPGLHIELQPGSYRAHFRKEPAPELPSLHAPETVERVPQPAVVGEVARPGSASPRRHLWWWGAIVFPVVLLGLLGYGWLRSVATAPQDRFWAPLLNEPQPLVVYLGSNAAYVLSDGYLSQYRQSHRIPNTGPEFFVDLPPGDFVQASDLVPVRGTFVTVGDLTAAVQVTSRLAEWKHPYALRAGNDLSFGDLRNKPSVMIGGFNNPWTLELTGDLPFQLLEGTRIQEREAPHRSWVIRKSGNGNTPDDYAVIARVLHSGTGGPLLIVAGVGEFGTQAAAEFVADPRRMRDLLQNGPAGWENRNLEAVLHIRVEGGAPVEMDVIATHFW